MTTHLSHAVFESAEDKKLRLAKANEYMKLWYKRHRQRVLDYHKRYAAKNKSKIAAYRTAYYLANKAEMLARSAAYKRTYAGRRSANESTRKRDAVKRHLKLLPPDRVLTLEEWEHIIRLSRGRCYWCHRKMEKATQDHVIPLSKGGLHEASNVVAACQSCNSKKGAKIVTLF